MKEEENFAILLDICSILLRETDKVIVYDDLNGHVGKRNHVDMKECMEDGIPVYWSQVAS